MNQKNKKFFEEISIKKVKNYWNEFPCNLKFSGLEIGTKEFFDEVEKCKYSSEPHITKFAEFEKWKDKKVLEIGCGIGTDTINFARAGANITAFDISEKSLSLAKQRAKVYGLDDKVNFYCGNAEELSKIIPLESYDLIYSFGVIHHSPHPEKIIEQIGFFIRPGTLIKLMVYNRFSWPVIWILIKGGGAFWKIDKLIANYSESQNCPITYTYSKKQAKELLRRFNIRNVSVDYGISYANHLKKIWNIKIFKPFFNIFKKTLGWHILIEAEAR